MSRICLFLTALLLLFKIAGAQQTYTWNAGAVGDYQVATNWSPTRTNLQTNDILAFNAAGAIVVANVPNQTIGSIRILSGTGAVSFATNVTTNILSLSAATPLIYSSAGSILASDLLTISLTNMSPFSISSGTFGIVPSTGGKIFINSALTLSGGTLDFDVVGTGGTIVNTVGSITYQSGTFNCTNAAAINWLNGSNYNHAVSGAAASTIPTCLWSAGSNCNITGMNVGTIAPAGLTNAPLANFNWNCPVQSGNVDLDFGINVLTVTGTFTITNTNTSAVRLSNATAVAVSAGSYNQAGGTFVLQSSTGSTNFTVTGNFNQTGGVIDYVTGSGSAIGLMNFKGNVTRSAGGTWQASTGSATAQMIVQFSGTSTQTVNLLGTTTAPAGGRSSVVNTNTDATGVTLTGSGTGLRVFNRSSTLIASCLNGGNFSGSVSISYGGSGAGGYGVTYNGSAPQTASVVEFPVGGPNNLEIYNNAGVSFPANFNRSLPGTLKMTMGNLAIGAANYLTLANTSLGGQLVYTSGNITSGTLKRWIPASVPNSLGAAIRFPFGSGANDRSLNLYFSSASITTGDTVAVSHAAIVNASPINPLLPDNGVSLNKRTNSSWIIKPGAAFALGTTTISLQVQATNIGSVDNITTLRLTDAATSFGTLVASSGSTDAPAVGKTGLSLADINNKSLYVGSDATNALQIVTFTWTGASNTAWANAGNWTGGVGYPSSPTEIAIINTTSGNMPVIATGTSVSVYQLIVSSPATFTMTGTGSISVADQVTISGAVSFSPTSTFTYSSSNTSQNILNLPYGNLTVSGSATKILPAATTVTGDFVIVQGATVPTFGTGTFIYDYAAGSALVQRIAPTSYYNLTVTGARGGRTIRLGYGTAASTISIRNNFVVTATNYIANDGGFVNTFDFISTGTQTIPGFTYNIINNTGNGYRIYDPLGSTDPNHVIYCKTVAGSNPALTNNYAAGSKIVMNRGGSAVTTLFTFPYHDLEIAGDMGGTNLSVAASGEVQIAGTFAISATNFKQVYTLSTINFNGTGNQTITAFKTNTATNTPAFKYSKLTVTNGNRTVTFGGSGTDTIGIYDILTVPAAASFTPGASGLVVAGSTINFITNSGSIPVLPPFATNGNNYNNLVVTGGVRTIAGDLKVGGNVAVVGSDVGVGSGIATLYIGNNVSDRIITIAGNLSVTGTTATSSVTGLIDFNSVGKQVQVKLAGNLSISGASQLTTGNGSGLKGTIVFNGTAQQYNNTALNKNKYVNFKVGDGTSLTNLTLNNNIELTRSGSAPFSDTLTVAANAILSAGTKNIKIGIDTLPATNNAAFILTAGSTLITSNTGIAPNTAIEGTAGDGTTGTLSSLALLTKNYNAGASYVLNGATVNPFPTTINTMANLTIGANVSLNRAITATGTLDLSSFTLTQAANNLQFSGLTSTTGNIYADKLSSLSISGSAGTVGPLRFALPGGNITGEFSIIRPVTVALASDLTIDKTPLTGNFITGTSASILDINSNLLTINGATTGTGSLSGSNASSLTLGGAAGTLHFTAAPDKQVLKNFTMVNNASATLGTMLDITGGTVAGTEGTLSITGSAVLTTGGNLTMKSNNHGTSRIAPGSILGGYINGDVTVERYLSSIRSWRLLSAPAYGQTIKQAWQENQAAGVNPGTGFGTNITSSSASWAANGYDFYTPGNSLLLYNVASNAWQGAATTNVQITGSGINKSYMLFLRGDRSVGPSVSATPTEAVIRIKGSVFQGDQAAVPVLAGKFANIGNNYASAIDFLQLTKTNTDQSFLVWDPKIPGSNSLGGWVTFSASTPVPWSPTPAGGSYSAGVSYTRIESGQAFLVHNSTTNAGSVVLKESSKLSGSNLVSRPLSPSGISSITTNLYNMSSGEAKIADGNQVVFSDNYSNVIDGKDAVKLDNFDDNFGIVRDGQALVIDARQPVAENDTIFFKLKTVKLQPYRLELSGYNFDNTITAYLEDNFLHTVTNLSLGGGTTYDFEINNTAGSGAADRFRIVFKNTPVRLFSFTGISATQKTNGIDVSWNVENESGLSSYEVERSSDGINFIRINTTLAAGAGTIATYNLLDLQAGAGDNYYRVKRQNSNGGYDYSDIAKVSGIKVKGGFVVYPNPVTDGSIGLGLQMNNIPAGNYTARMINNYGQVVSKNTFKHTGGSGTTTIVPNTNLANGTYQLEIRGADNKPTVINVLVQGK